MPEASHTAAPRAIGYALNVFPCETWPDLLAVLESEVLQIKQRAFPGQTFPVELRFSEKIIGELCRCENVARLKHFLDVHDLALVSVNGFVMPHFHGERVKERVYLPAWHESRARLQFTNLCVDVLAQLTPPDAGIVSVSVPFGALKPVRLDDIAPNILLAADHAAKVEASTGKHCVIALEPEPGLCVETTAEAIAFFQRIPSEARRYLGVNFDLSHQLVEFEDLHQSVLALQQAGVMIAKVHISNAAEMTDFEPFYDQSIYLHQVTGADESGALKYFSLDWPDTPPPKLAKYRVHYHLPVCPSPFSSTLPDVQRFLRRTLPVVDRSVPAIIETYTWPEQMRGRSGLVDNICRELDWVRHHALR
jgi:hypothetical protein